MGQEGCDWRERLGGQDGERGTVMDLGTIHFKGKNMILGKSNFKQWMLANLHILQLHGKQIFMNQECLGNVFCEIDIYSLNS